MKNSAIWSSFYESIGTYDAVGCLLCPLFPTILSPFLPTTVNLKMKFHAVFSLFAITGTVLAAPEPAVEKRQYSSVIAAIREVHAATSDFDKAVVAHSGDGKAVLIAYAKVNSILLSAVHKVYSSTGITVKDTLDIQIPIVNLQTTITSAMEHLVAKKPAILGAGHGADIAALLQVQSSGLKVLGLAFASKAPAEVSSVALQLYAGTWEAVGRGFEAFKAHSRFS
jgi:Hydrophobic surface binding protein A